MDQGSGFGTTVFKFPHDFPINRASEKEMKNLKVHIFAHEPKKH